MDPEPIQPERVYWKTVDAYMDPEPIQPELNWSTNILYIDK